MTELDEIRERTAGHTPGPWQRLNAKDVFTKHDERRARNSGYQIADCAMDYAMPDEEPMAYEEQMANAALCSAAPDLLALAREAVDELDEAVRLLREHVQSWDRGNLPCEYDMDEDYCYVHDYRGNCLVGETNAFLARQEGEKHE